MRYLQPIIITACAAVLAACGSGSDSSAGSSPNPSAIAKARAAVANDAATAAQVALAKRGKVHCPATVNTPPRATGMPVDDVQGVRPGLTYEEAANLIACTNALLIIDPQGGGFQFQQYGYKVRQGFATRFAHEIVLKSHRQIVHDLMHGDPNDKLHAGEVKWNVSTMGLPGKERVISLWRDEWFAAGKNPTTDSVQQALIKKYGKPTRVYASDSRPELCWSYDKQGSPIPNGCNGARVDGSFSVAGRSGIAVQAWINPMDTNHALARDVIVNVVDDAGGYAAIMATQKGLKAMDAQRRAAQVKKATTNADAAKF